MANTRVKDFPTTFNPATLTALQSVFTWVDKQGFTEAQKYDLASSLTSAIVTGNTIDYKSMTPKAFWDSIMSETRRGVGLYATDANITGKSGDGLLRAGKQPQMQEQWLSDWYIANGPAVTVHQNAAGSSLFAQVFTVCWEGSLAAGGIHTLTPPLLASKEISRCYITGSVRLGTQLDAGAVIDMENRGPAAEYQIGATDMFYGAPAAWNSVYIKNGYTAAYNIAVAATFHMTMIG